MSAHASLRIALLAEHSNIGGAIANGRFDLVADAAERIQAMVRLAADAEPQAERPPRASFCDHDGGQEPTWWEHDLRGLPLAKVCARCLVEKLTGYSLAVLNDEQREAIGQPARSGDEESYEERAAAYGESIDGEGDL